MKKILILPVLICSIASSFAYAETETKTASTLSVQDENIENGEIVINDTIYVPKRKTNVRFFVGLEAPLVFYSTENITFDLVGDDITQKYTEFRLNESLFNNTSLSFGFDIGGKVRIGFELSHRNTMLKIDREKEELGTGHYGISVDGFFDSSLSVSPFLRLGIGCITAKNESIDYSSVFFRAGVGVNYKITENIFSYALMDYTFVPEGDIDNIDASIDGNVFSISLGIGYKF